MKCPYFGKVSSTILLILSVFFCLNLKASNPPTAAKIFTPVTEFLEHHVLYARCPLCGGDEIEWWGVGVYEHMQRSCQFGFAHIQSFITKSGVSEELFFQLNNYTNKSGMRGTAAEDHHFKHVVSWFGFARQTLEDLQRQRENLSG